MLRFCTTVCVVHVSEHFFCKVASVLLDLVMKPGQGNPVPPLQTLHSCTERSRRTRRRVGERRKDKDLSFNLGSAVGESGVCLDKPGSLWAAEMIQREEGEQCESRMEGQRGARGKGAIERYQKQERNRCCKGVGG